MVSDAHPPRDFQARAPRRRVLDFVTRPATAADLLPPAVRRMREAYEASARLRQEIETRRLAAEGRRRAIPIQNQNQNGGKNER